MPSDGLYLSGLGSFASRTCYANSSGDHLVRWTILVCCAWLRGGGRSVRTAPAVVEPLDAATAAV